MHPADDVRARSGRIGRAAAVITFWNLISRATGFARVLATATALGIAVLGDTYQRSNQVSNVLFELLAGGMLFSVLVPTFVDLLHRDDPDETRALAGALATRGVAVLAVVVALGMAASHGIMSILSVAASPETREAQVELGTFLLWFILPQLLFYAAGSVASAVLQADRRFAAISLAPACNNVVVTVTMVAFAATHDPARGLSLTGGEKVLLGGGTLAGTVAMTVIPFLALHRAGLGIRPRWKLPPVDLRPLAKRGAWGAGHVGLNELLVLSTVVFAGWVNGGVIAYQTAFTFFLLPHALLAHPIFTALFPRLSRDGSRGDVESFARDLSTGLRSMLIMLLPGAGLLAVVAAPALSVVRFGQLDADGTRLVSLVLAAYLTGLAGYSAFFLLTRASYALGDARLPTLVNAGVTGSTIAGMLVAAAVTDGTALLVSFGLVHAVAATVGSVYLFFALRRSLQVPVPVGSSLARAAAAAAFGSLAALATTLSIGWDTRWRAVAAVAVAAPLGLVVCGTTLTILRTPELVLVRARLSGAFGRRA